MADPKVIKLTQAETSEPSSAAAQDGTPGAAPAPGKAPGAGPHPYADLDRMARAGLAGMTGEVRVPRLQSSAIERQAQHGRLAIEEPMKGHRKMRLHAIRELDHVGGREAIGHDTVQLLPQYDGAVGHLVQRLKQML